MRSGAALLSGTLACAALGAEVAPVRPFVNHRDPPAWVSLAGEDAQLYDLGHQVSNTSFLPAGMPGAGRRAGLGPLYNGSSCDECHNEGAHGRGPVGEGPAPDALVFELQGEGATGDDPAGDPVYGRVFNIAAVPGFKPEGQVIIHYRDIEHPYPDGQRRTLREPRYEFTQLSHGPLAPHTLVKPRITPALFGVGLLEAAEVSGGPRGRFGWQAGALSVRDQTTRAFSREMGLSNPDRPSDDCTVRQPDCLNSAAGQIPDQVSSPLPAQAMGQAPDRTTGQTTDQTTGKTAAQAPGISTEVSEQLLQAVLVFQKWLAVPQSPLPAQPDGAGERLFTAVGCAGCHQTQLTARFTGGVSVRFSPYTDLKVHDLGLALADHDVSGVPRASLWRTAPLWGLGYRLSRERAPTFLHDGRARSPEEAILWHDGEAAATRQRFEKLSASERQRLLDFLSTL